jgi:hypothetical protein
MYTEQSHIWEADSRLAIQLFPAFCGTDGSLSCWQEPATEPFPDAVEFGPYLDIQFQFRFNVILP